MADAHPKILLIGKNGQVGWELQRTLAPLGRLVCVGYPDVNLANEFSIRQQIRQVQPGIIVNAAAYTDVDRAECEPELAMKINGVAPGTLAEEAYRIGALLVHFSTDYVFDGMRSDPYDEEAVPNPLNTYGRSKLQGDQAIQQVNGHHIIFRLCWVYGNRGKNFMLTILRLARELTCLRVVKDQIGSPTWSRTIAETTALAIKQVRDSQSPARYFGVYHLSALGQTSWHGFAESIVALMPEPGKKCLQVEAISSDDYHSLARRPAYSVLSGEKLNRTFGLHLPHWEDSLRLSLLIP